MNNRHHPRHLSAQLIGGCVALTLLGGASFVTPAHAHQASITRSFVSFSADRRQVSYRMTLDPPDIAEMLGLPVDTSPSDDQIAAGTTPLFDAIFSHITIKNGEAACPLERGAAAAIHKGSRFIQLTFTARCAEPVDTLVVEYDLFFELDALHRGLITVEHNGTRGVFSFKPGEGRYQWTLGQAPPSIICHFIVEGVEHIVLGYDHVAFLLSLLLVIAFCRRSSGGFQPRALRPGLRYTAAIVTSFTVAHSITLISASMGWISLDSQIVESIIALSIIYIAVENIVRPDASYRYLVTFGFGLIHGLGFASVLADSLPPTDVVVPLLMFNVGVELGQLAIVAVVLPLLVLATRALGADRYRATVSNVGSGILAIFGLLWLIERIADVTILGL